jgi:membrane protein
VLLTQFLPAAIVFGLLLCLFRVLPASGASLRAAWPGALAATIALALVQLGEEAYFSGPGKPSDVYGSIAALLVVVLSVYINAIVVALGAHISAVAARLPDGARDGARHRDRPPARRPVSTLGRRSTARARGEETARSSSER